MTDLEQKYWWEQRINSLTQLEAIELTRGLNGEENQIKAKIMKEIADKTNDVNTLAINGAAYAPPPAKPPRATAVDIGAEVLNAIKAARFGAPMVPPAKVRLPGPKVPPPPGPMVPPPSPPMAPPPALPMAPPPVIRNNQLGPLNGDAAEVKVDSVANRRQLEQLLTAKYGNRRAPAQDIETWQAALAEFDVRVSNYVNPAGTKAFFYTYIIKELNKHTKESDIFVCYLVEPDNLGNVTIANINKYRGPNNPSGYDSTLSKIAESSEQGKFYFHPNYRLV